jgi:integrase
VLRKKLGPTYVKPARRPSVDEGKMTLTDFFETRFMPNVAMKPKTELGRLGDFRNHIEPVLGDTRLDKLTVSQVVDWRTGLRAKGLKPSSQKRLDSLLHRVLEVARFERRIDANPAARLPRGSDHEEAEKSYVWLDPGQVRELTLAIQPPNYQALVATMYATGIRMGEASGLRVRNLDLDNGTLTVSENAVLVGGKRTLGTPKTRGSRRTIALHPAIAAGLRQHLAYFSDATDPDAWVFTNGRGNPVRGDNFGRALKRAAKVAKVPAPKPKDFRDMLTHTLELQGASEREKAAILGRTRLTTTAGYGGGPDLARLRALAEAQDVPALAVALGS